MRKKINIILFTIVIAFVLFNNKVYANSYAIYLKTNSSDILKIGDVIELYAGIACANDEFPVSYQKFTLLFDKNIFEVVEYDMVDYNDDKNYKLRDGWIFKSFGRAPGQFNIEMSSKDHTYNIGDSIASQNCLDSIEAELVSFKLKVKDVENQKTKIQVIDQNSYVEELDFTINEPSSNNYLSTLGVENYVLDSDFNKNDTEYKVYVPHDTEKINIFATTEANTSTLVGIGEKQLVEGKNKFEVSVTSENGNTKIYTINVIRKNISDDTDLSKISVLDSNKKEVELSYNKVNKQYVGSVSSDVAFVSFDIACGEDDCFVDKLEPEALVEGKNEFKFKVIFENGDEKEYQIIINRDYSKMNNLNLFLLIGLVISIITSIIFMGLYIKSKKQIKNKI